MFNIFKSIKTFHAVTVGGVTILTYYIFIMQNKKLLDWYKEQIEESSRIVLQLRVDSFTLKGNPNLSIDQSEALKLANESLTQLENTNSVMEKAITLWQNAHLKLWDGDTISTLLQNFREFLDTLTLDQLWAVCHILSSIFILILVFNIITIIYSDYLLTYLKIEDKYPGLGRLVRIRKISQQYYLVLNLFLIITTVLATIFINYTVLVN